MATDSEGCLRESSNGEEDAHLAPSPQSPLCNTPCRKLKPAFSEIYSISNPLRLNKERNML